MGGRRCSSSLVLLVLAAALLGVVPASSAQASCVGPVIAVGDSVDDGHRPTSGVLPAAGSGATVSGLWFFDGCDDTSDGSGCAGPVASSQSPVADVPLVLQQGGSSWALGRVDAGSAADRYATRWKVRVPDGAQPGPATLRAGTTATLPVTIAG